jgi:hypothetical protein
VNSHNIIKFEIPLFSRGIEGIGVE